MATVGPYSTKKTQTPTQGGKAGSPKRRRIAGATGTPRQRAMMFIAALACCVVAFFIPRIDSEDQGAAEKNEVQPAQPGTDNISNNSPEKWMNNGHISPAPPSSRLMKADSNSLPPLADLLQNPAVSPEQIEARLSMLNTYFCEASPKEIKNAFQALLDLGDGLVDRLPKLIEQTNTAALTHYVNAARHFRAINTIPALIARIESRNRKAIALPEIFEALASFEDPEVVAYLFNTLSSPEAERRQYAWKVLRPNFNAQQFDLVFKIASEGGPDCFPAAKALARHCYDHEKTTMTILRIEQALQEKHGKAKLALIEALCGIDAAASRAILAILSVDMDPAVRAAVMWGLVRNPTTVNIVQAALRSDSQNRVRAVCIQAFIAYPDESILTDLIGLLNTPELRGLAHRALVQANQGVDMGWQDFKWQSWYHARSGNSEKQLAPVAVERPPSQPTPNESLWQPVNAGH